MLTPVQWRIVQVSERVRVGLGSNVNPGAMAHCAGV